MISGACEAVLINGGFTLPGDKALVAPIKAALPEARVIAASATIMAIKGNLEKKLATWGPQLKENGPQAPADIVMPEAFDGRTLTLECEIIEIADADGLANRCYIWAPSLNAIVGGVLLFSGVHVWTTDTQGAEARAAWVKTLDAMAARKPAVVIPGHMAPGAATDATAIACTQGERSAVLFMQKSAPRPYPSPHKWSEGICEALSADSSSRRYLAMVKGRRYI